VNTGSAVGGAIKSTGEAVVSSGMAVLEATGNVLKSAGEVVASTGEKIATFSAGYTQEQPEQVQDTDEDTKKSTLFLNSGFGRI